VIAPAAKQALVPTATSFYIGYSNQWLRTHLASLTNSVNADVTCLNCPDSRALSGSSANRK
jgi:hypothetical protein